MILQSHQHGPIRRRLNTVSPDDALLGKNRMWRCRATRLMRPRLFLPQVFRPSRTNTGPRFLLGEPPGAEYDNREKFRSKSHLLASRRFRADHRNLFLTEFSEPENPADRRVADNAVLTVAPQLIAAARRERWP